MAYLNQAKLKEDIEKYMTTTAEVYCREGMYEITKMAHYAMAKFYADYKPKYYDRTYDLFDPKKHELSNGSVIPYYHNNGKRIYGGVRISSENMSLYQPYSKSPTNPADVAWFAWHGYHGHPLRDISMSVSPLDIVRKMMKKEQFLKKIANAALDAAKKQKYNYLKLK